MNLNSLIDSNSLIIKKQFIYLLYFFFASFAVRVALNAFVSEVKIRVEFFADLFHDLSRCWFVRYVEAKLFDFAVGIEIRNVRFL